MSHTRRSFLKAGALTAAAVAVPARLLAGSGRRAEPVALHEGAALRELAFRAVEAARSAGAAYADVRLTHTRDLQCGGTMSRISGVSKAGALGSINDDSEALAVGVRALVHGYWGFAASTVWTPDEMARLGRAAVAQARTNALGKPRRVELAPISVVRDGEWTTPIERDPFTVPVNEMLDQLGGLAIWVSTLHPSLGGAGVGAMFKRQEKAFASSDGAFFAQTTFQAGANISFTHQSKYLPLPTSMTLRIPLAGRGWEYIRTFPVEARVLQAIEEYDAIMALPEKPVEVGRYDTVFSPRVAASLLARTLGQATELDRALGYEANASGTSYLNDPFHMLGHYEAGSPLLTLTANRSLPGGLATVGWDDEGVAPEDFTLVKEGMLVDFQTTRESAGWLEDYHARTGKPFRSHGCASTDTALDAPLSHVPNLRLEPAREQMSTDDLIAEMKTGIEVKYLTFDMDFQGLNGFGSPPSGTIPFLEIKNGKRVARINGPGLLFRTTEFWKGLLAVGGANSLEPEPVWQVKGEPPQRTSYTVEAPPIKVKQVTIIDNTRKA